MVCWLMPTRNRNTYSFLVHPYIIHHHHHHHHHHHIVTLIYTHSSTPSSLFGLLKISLKHLPFSAFAAFSLQPVKIIQSTSMIADLHFLYSQSNLKLVCILYTVYNQDVLLTYMPLYSRLHSIVMCKCIYWIGEHCEAFSVPVWLLFLLHCCFLMP